jgi:hypothetical protein
VRGANVQAPDADLDRQRDFTVSRGKIAQIDILADPERISRLDLAALD